MVFVLDMDADPEEARPTTLFATDPEMEPERMYRIHVDRFQIEFNFRDAKQHLGLAACQARTEARHHFHVNAVLAALAWTRLELRHAANQALARFSMANVKTQVLPGTGLAAAFRHGRAGPDPADPARPGPNRVETDLNPPRILLGIRRSHPHSGLRNPCPTGRGDFPCPCISQKLFTSTEQFSEPRNPLEEAATGKRGEGTACVGINHTTPSQEVFRASAGRPAGPAHPPQPDALRPTLPPRARSAGIPRP